ncbi:MAG: substrate-binding domain-containing protein, partial [Clostridia bacterium]|nr:substrate-binding domain-containing protein [Clostridia bacterium]
DIDDEMEDAMFAAQGIRIGVTIGDLNSDTDKMLLGRLEQASNAAEESKLVYEVYYYNAQGDPNQQLQDVRSLIKNEVDAIIVGGTTKESFDMVVALANDAGIPVVAYNAPPGASGYVINIVADQSDWGSVYGDFMADNLDSGRIVQVLGSEDNELDIERASAINAALATNENISTKDTLYEKWDNDDAYDAMVEYLDEEGYVPGVITEEGMAQGVLDAFIEIERLPIVMCGDVSAGFIKTWYALKTIGIDITPEPEDDDEEVATVIFKSKVGEMIVCAQPAPVSIGAVAFEIAFKLAEGRTLKVSGATYVYTVETVITDSNLPKYYAMVRDEKDDVLVRDIVSQETIENLLNPPEETEEEADE